MKSISPLVSVVTATYNRSNVLRYSLKSLVNQDFQNWECIVIGDACTDDTGEVISSLNDNRISFINLKENTGDQADPNNHGCSLAQGKYIAFLNHDDLWFSDHLSLMVSALESSGVDLVYAINATVFSDDTIRIRMIHETGCWEPHVFVPASAWLFRREMVETVGPWHSFRQTHTTPSQDWLFRAWKKKHRFMMNPRLTVIMVFGSFRDQAYSRREVDITKTLCLDMKDADNFRDRIIRDSMILAVAGETSKHPLKHLKKFFRSLIYKVLTALGFSPQGVLNFFRYGIHGGFIPYLSKKRGLEKKK